MRVLVVCTDFPPHRLGGYELKCAAWVARARAAGHEVRVLTSARAGAAADSDPEVRRDLVRFPASPRPVAAAQARAGERRNRAALAHHLAAFAPDVVSWWRLGELSMSLPCVAGVPGVGVVGDPWMVDGPRRDPWAAREPAPLDLPGRWLFVSEALRRDVLAEGVRLEAHEVVPEAVELAAFPARPPRAWEGRLLYAGRLSPLKGIQDAIAAVHRTAGVTLTVAGAGDPAFERELRAMAGERVRFVGAVAHDAVGGLLADHDALLFPSRWAEPSGRIPLEAMASCRPVIASGTGGSGATLRHEDTALVAPPGDIAAWSAAIGRLAAEPRLRTALVARGRVEALAHDAERVDARLLAAHEAAATARPRAAGGAARRPAHRR